MSSRRRNEPPPPTDAAEGDPRSRILDAAFTAFVEHGFAAASTLDIATRARVSKRELYALVGNKEQMLVACIESRAERMRAPADLPVPRDRDALAYLLTSFGTQLLREVTDPVVIAVFRLAIAEATNAPEVARALDSIGREATRSATRKIMTNAESAGLVDGKPEPLAEQFASLLFGDVIMGLLLGVAERPSAREMARHARDAAATFLELHPPRAPR